METFKRSMSRDFRINHQAVDAILNEGEGEGEGEVEKEGEEGEGGVVEHEDGGQHGPPKSKRLKL